MFLKLGTPLISLAALILTACATNTTGTAPRAISEYCLIAKAITYSEQHEGDVEDASNKYDTPETVKQVRDNDLAYEKVCKPQ